MLIYNQLCLISFIIL